MEQKKQSEHAENFSKILDLWGDVAHTDFTTLTRLEQDGIVKRFHLTTELAWKTLKDKMEHDGFVLQQLSPKGIIRQAWQAWQAKYLDDAEPWLRMINDRNLLTLTYDATLLVKTLPDVQQIYLPLFRQLRDNLAQDL
ncbi:MAG: nucleotidyltransferase substrate binding protein [Candidatus Cyclonatronum sp.]|uniref:HI0074 family nucleotidyltransferase substrate-binding subunit n=1 Tax=Cyclonatronum sp. TaxID=3024185 RepID=UPI0025BEAC41|nr:HI0074 family nucleotidyltransferase substrate-binding subunit [Cyclonatronum sp.]MCH8488209.1 nucleotidyltransferase substrate binding protein [Cyclonatronum sp.]